MTTPITSFRDLELPAPLLSALAEVGYETPSPIQAACIPHLLAGRDLLGEAQTGTGKTAAFALPALARLDLANFRPQVLVLTPTRELAIQVAEAFQKYAHHLPGFHVLPLYGGQSMVVQLRQLKRGAHVIVGTPGRIMDHLERGSLVLDGLSTLVLDEADEMLRMGFIDDVEWILEHTPAERQTALFSATMPEAIRRVAHRHLREPQEVKIRAATATVAAIRQRYWQVRGVDKLDALTRILEVEDDFDAAIVFVRTKTATVELAERLEARGYAAAALNGDMTQGLREQVIERLKNGSLDIVVATDVAARGIDVPRVSHVINYDIPYDTEAYVHRIGRTGRAGRQGTAILFVAPRETRMLKSIERATRQPIEAIALPTREAVAGRRVAQFRQQIVDTLEKEDLAFFMDVINGVEEEEGFKAHEIAAALAFLATRDRPLQIEETGRGWDVATAPQSAGRAERPPRERRDEAPARRHAFSDGQLTRYRIEVGREHGVSPKEIVGAIANEGGIEGRYIGQIHLFDDYSTVELPKALPAELLGLLKRVRVRQRPLAIRELGAAEAEALPERRRPTGGFKERAAGGERPPRKWEGGQERPRAKPSGERHGAPKPHAGKPVKRFRKD
ncbi:DEAD/DEAH box helicase [Pseudothauera rhizosphaerae]|uniref:ATP-dependent RNA helicase DeaD n=1 Tax=Pseudothauera rhizosphaerae TaxID=2565932 RepID=A0A4S4AUM4_9RHOO|nr:DEAD/DEAH box helicase [Pseudothauera rhizosphaerae]THF63484.1 DEAD/DEAH box helicase [Pseudothauera rhizosphaerae]